jgi:hypothetical protein
MHVALRGETNAAFEKREVPRRSPKRVWLSSTPGNRAGTRTMTFANYNKSRFWLFCIFGSFEIRELIYIMMNII